MATIYKTPKSKFWQCEVWYKGRKFSRSTGKTSRREAEARARELEEEVVAEQKVVQASHSSLTLDAVAGRYMVDIGDGKKYASQTRQIIAHLIKHFGPDKLITEITHEDVQALKHARGRDKVPHTDRPISQRTVNFTVVQLRTLFGYCRERGVVFTKTPIWKKLLFKVPAERPRELHEDEAERLDAAMREDYGPILDFMELTGRRLAECVNLRWRHVHWDTGSCEWTGKGDKPVSVPITLKLRAILWPLRGHHPEHVFTYVARRTHIGIKDTGGGRKGRPATVKGERYPITIKGLKQVWERIKADAQIADFRLHDFRHNTGTKVLRKTGNLKIAQKLLGHSSSKTTADYYGHVTETELGAAMDGAARDKNHRSDHRSDGAKVVKMPVKSA